jgi:hypothetical protein
MIDQKQVKNVEYFSYPGSIITNYARCTCEIESRIDQQINLKFKDETSKVLHLGHSFVWYSDLDTSKK